MRRRIRRTFGFGALLVMPAVLLAQGGISRPLVLVPVKVTDELNRVVTGLDQNAFEVYEDKVRQNIVSFGRSDAPQSIGIVLDASASMGSSLERCRLAVGEILKWLSPADEAFLLELSDRPQLTVPMTRNADDIRSRLNLVDSKGRTALWDGVYLVLNTMEKAHNSRRALIVISDGYDNGSLYNAAEVGSLVRQADVRIYGIGIAEAGVARGRTAADLSGQEKLRYLSEPTGGRTIAVENTAELPDMAAKIGAEIRDQYFVEYSSGNEARDGKYRKISIRVIAAKGDPPLRAFWKAGYFAPTN